MNYPDTGLFIDGQWRQARDGRILPVSNPATGTPIGAVAHASIHDLDEALQAAQRGFDVWRDLLPAARSPIMRRAAALLRERAPEIARCITLDQGKPTVESLAEVRAEADIIDWFAEEGFRVYGRIVPSRIQPAARQQVVKDPVSPVAAFTPWIFPIIQMVRKAAAALSAECSILVKAPEEAPSGPAALAQSFADAGLPQGVLGLVFGNPAEISKHLIAHSVICKITFTGSTAVGKTLAAQAGQHMKRVTMELGGHAPVIVCEDAEVARAATVLVSAMFRNGGQVCIAPTRFLLHVDIEQAFTKQFSQLASGLRVGSALEPEIQMGPLANARRVHAMTRLQANAIECGADVVVGGGALGSAGNFWAPTVLSSVPAHADVFNEEPFGSIAAISTFERLDTAIAEANRLPYGLAGYAFTNSLKNSDLISKRVEVGMMWINQAASGSAELSFGGIKDSGYGSEGGPEAMEAYLNTRTVCVNSA